MMITQSIRLNIPCPTQFLLVLVALQNKIFHQLEVDGVFIK